MFICGVALLSGKALSGVMTYVVGHGFTKGALFMCTGILLHRFATVDEYDLHGRGRDVPAAGVLMALGALLLAALPPVTTFMGKSLLEDGSTEAGYGWLIAVFIFASTMTGGAVLRITGGVFLGWGPREGPHPEQARAAEERVETRGEHDHTPGLMIAVPAALLLGALVAGLIPGAVPGAERYAAQFISHPGYAGWVLHGARVPLPELPPSHVSAADYVYGALSTVGALLAAAIGLFGRGLRARIPRGILARGRSALRRHPRPARWSHRRLHRLVERRGQPDRRNMPGRAALKLAAIGALLGLVGVGCAQPGTQAPRPEAAKLAVGTADISTACGYLEERAAFAKLPAKSRSALEAMAQQGARKLASVYARDQTGIYQGDRIGAVLGDSISLLHDCGLHGAQLTLERALARHG